MVGGGRQQQPSVGKTNMMRTAERVWSPGTLGNILSTGLPGLTSDAAPGSASLHRQITASEPRQGGERP